MKRDKRNHSLKKNLVYSELLISDNKQISNFETFKLTDFDKSNIFNTLGIIRKDCQICYF